MGACRNAVCSKWCSCAPRWRTLHVSKKPAQSEWGLGELGAEAPVFDEVFHMRHFFDMVQKITSPGAGHWSVILGNTPLAPRRMNSLLTYVPKRPARKMAETPANGLDLDRGWYPEAPKPPERRGCSHWISPCWIHLQVLTVRVYILKLESRCLISCKTHTTYDTLGTSNYTNYTTCIYRIGLPFMYV